MVYTPFFDWDSVRSYFEEKARCLQRVEKKNHAWMGFSPDRYTIYELENRRFILVMSRTFEGVLTIDLPNATQEYPELFGTGNPGDVLKALFNVRSGYDSYSLEEYRELLANENFGWIVEVDLKTLHPIDHFIRVDLYRGIAKNDFRGGVLHSFKHFALDGVPLSHNKDKNNIATTADIIPIIITGFFLSQWEADIKINQFVSFSDYDENYELKYVFYLQTECNVFFLNTIIKKLRRSAI